MEYLTFVGRMYGLDPGITAERTRELLDFMELSEKPKTLVTDFSHGMQKKLAMAAAVIHGPKILFLDEPFEGVDAVASGTLKAILEGVSRLATQNIFSATRKQRSLPHLMSVVTPGHFAVSFCKNSTSKPAMGGRVIQLLFLSSFSGSSA